MTAREQLTYRLETVDDLTTIVCLLCDSQSCHPDDIDNRYCARCHLFHDAVQLARRLTTHECPEWMTAVGDCAVCGSVVSHSLHYLKGRKRAVPLKE